MNGSRHESQQRWIERVEDTRQEWGYRDVERGREDIEKTPQNDKKARKDLVTFEVKVNDNGTTR